MDLSGQLYGPVALSAREEPRYTFKLRFGGSQTVEVKKKYLPLPGIEANIPVNTPN
jgi:hypothetical protein